MFTGIVQGLGQIGGRSGSLLMIVPPAQLKENLILGGSIAVNGACLTVSETRGDTFLADISAETAARTTLGRLPIGARVNLELPLTPQSLIDGHIVLGHIDAVGRIKSLYREQEGWTLIVAYPSEFCRYVAEKGSIAVDGISLTPYATTTTSFRCAVIPTTFTATNLQDRRVGDTVNLEFDVLAKYVERRIEHVH